MPDTLSTRPAVPDSVVSALPQCRWQPVPARLSELANLAWTARFGSPACCAAWRCSQLRLEICSHPNGLSSRRKAPAL